MTDEVRATLADAAKFLRRREYSAAELKLKLSSKHSEQDTLSALLLLSEAGLVSDKRATVAVVHSATSRKIVGDNEVRAKLEKLGIPQDVIEETITDRLPSEMVRAKMLVEKKFSGPTPMPKIARFLYSRGFDESTIESVLENLPGGESE